MGELQAVVSSEEAEAMARRVGLKFYRACVKENLNVTEGGWCITPKPILASLSKTDLEHPP